MSSPARTCTSTARAAASIPAAVVCVLAGEITAVNRRAREIFGAPADDLVGTRLDRWLNVSGALERVAADAGDRAWREIEGRRANGVPFPLTVSVHPDPGHAEGVILLLHEPETDELVGLARRFFDVGFDGAPIGMALFNTDGEYVRVNDELCRMLGRSRSELLGRRDQELTHPDDRQIDVDAAWEILEGRRSTFQCEKRYVRPDGSLVWVLANLSFLRDDTGRPLAWVAQIQDVSDRRAAEDALRVSEERHRLLLRNLPKVGVVLYDRELRCQLIEGRHMEQLSADVDAMLGRPMGEILPEAFAQRLEPLARRALAGTASSLELHSPLSDRLLVADVAPHRGPDGEISGALFLVRDVTDERAAENARSKAEWRFEVAFERAPIGMVMVGPDGRFERVNHALCRMTGYDSAQLQTMAPFAIVHPDERDGVAAAFASLAEGVEDLTLEHRCVHADGDAIWVSIHATMIRDADGTPMHALVQVQNIDERRRHELELQHIADHDLLTGLLNRRGFSRALDEHVERTRRYGAAGALLMLDLDGFKAVNDTLGHQAGDELIAGCARALSARLRDSDVIARIGGDEFAVLLPMAGESEAEIVARDLVDVIRGHHAGGAHEAALRVTVSIGVAALVTPSATADEMLGLADRAMYAAKRAGRNRHAVHRQH